MHNCKSYTMKKKILPLEITTEDGEYIIPTEYYNNAILKKAKKQRNPSNNRIEKTEDL